MIPTRHKTKISQAMSYPVGAEFISAALDGAPQYSSMSLWFGQFSHSVYLRPGHASRYGVLSAYYSHQLPSRFTGRNLPVDCQPTWHLSIYEVPRVYRYRVRQLLENEGIPRLRAWLEGNVHIIGQVGACSLVLYFDETQQTLEFENEAHLEPVR